MEKDRKGTKVYTRDQSGTGREITVRKLRGEFILLVNNAEAGRYSTQAAAMEAADRIAEESISNLVRLDFEAQ